MPKPVLDAEINRRELIVLGSLLFSYGLSANPWSAYAADLESGDSDERFTIDSIPGGVAVADALTGDHWRALGDLSSNGDVLTIEKLDGPTSEFDMEMRRVGAEVRAGEIPVIALSSHGWTGFRNCVDMKRRRYTVNSDAVTVGSAVAALSTVGLGLPYSAIATIASVLVSISQVNRPKYLETVTYYCDSPKKMMKYVTNYYADSSYKKKVNSSTTEVPM